MFNLKRLTAAVLAAAVLLSISSCKKANPGLGYPKESAGGTGYGAGVKSSLYIEDFYFLSVGTKRTDVELMLGSPHYTEEGNSLYSLYELNNGDSIALTYKKDEQSVSNAVYEYADGSKRGFFDMLVELGILKSSGSATQDPTVSIPDGNTAPSENDKPGDTTGDASDSPEQNTPTQSVTQGDVFATGMYNFALIEPALSIGAQRDGIIASVGKPSYFSSHSFAAKTYIFDCYNLNDGSKLYLDYGFARDNLRCAVIYKNGAYTSLLGAQWSEQALPAGFTYKTVSRTSVGRLIKNLTPERVYRSLGEPSWYEGSRGSYTDVYILDDGAQAYLNFGTAHNRLTSLSIKETDGTSTVVRLN